MSAVAVLALSRRTSGRAVDRVVPRPPASPSLKGGEGVAGGVAARRKKKTATVTVCVPAADDAGPAGGEQVAPQKPSTGRGEGAGSTGRGWTALRKLAGVSELSKSSKAKRDEQRLQRKHGTNIGPNADSPRWDVQQTYRQLFFPHRQTHTDPNDPFVDDGLSGHWSSIVAENSKSQEARERLHVVDMLKRRFKSASVKIAKVSFPPDNIVQLHARWHPIHLSVHCSAALCAGRNELV